MRKLSLAALQQSISARSWPPHGDLPPRCFVRQRASSDRPSNASCRLAAITPWKPSPATHGWPHALRFRAISARTAGARSVGTAIMVVPSASLAASISANCSSSLWLWYREHFAYALFVPAGWKLLCAHRGFLGLQHVSALPGTSPARRRGIGGETLQYPTVGWPGTQRAATLIYPMSGVDASHHTRCIPRKGQQGFEKQRCQRNKGAGYVPDTSRTPCSSNRYRFMASLLHRPGSSGR